MWYKNSSTHLQRSSGRHWYLEDDKYCPTQQQFHTFTVPPISTNPQGRNDMWHNKRWRETKSWTDKKGHAGQIPFRAVPGKPHFQSPDRQPLKINQQRQLSREPVHSEFKSTVYGTLGNPGRKQFRITQTWWEETRKNRGLDEFGNNKSGKAIKGWKGPRMAAQEICGW